jgi:DNA-binding beta-propeller fold protein YncE/mono/diheme cytochrome c family protein
MNSLMDLSSDGRLLACSNRDSGSITVLEQTNGTWAKKSETHVGRHPEGVSFIGKSHNLAVAVYGDDAVVLLNANDGKETGRVEVFDEPYSVVSTADGDRLFVTLDYPGKIAEIDPASKKVIREIEAGPFARGLALTSDGRLLVTEYYTGAMHAIDRTTGQRLESWKGTKEDNLARQITLHPSRPKAYLTHIRSRTTVPQGAGAIFPYVAVVDTDAPKPVEEGSTPPSRRKRVQMDSFRGTFVVANPWEATVAPDGKHLAVVFAGTDDMFLCNIIDDDFRELSWAATVRTGHNPRAVRYTDDGSQLLVYNALDFSVSVLDAGTMKKVQDVSVCDCPLDDEMLAGKRLFYSANQPMVGLRWISCSSCHPDGDSDGRTWQQPEGLRQTQPLAGMAWTHPLHWSADRDEVQDFEHTIRGPLMQGKGLVRGAIPEALGEPISGRSKEADALAMYANSHKFDLSPYARMTNPDGTRQAGLTDAARRGREVFFRDSVGCANCHNGPYFCDSRAGSLTRHDVGTGNDDKSELMGPKYDTPTLIGLYRSAPYLHHGKAATLEDVLTTCNTSDRHGKTSQLSKAEIGDLVEFLKSLPYEDTDAQALAAGLKKVEK